MFRFATEEELRKTFRPRDRKTLELPVGLRFPLILRASLAWVDPTGVRAHGVFSTPEGPLGLSFRRDTTSGAALCDWCHSYGGQDQVGLVVCERSSKRRVGLWLCRDLGCVQRAEDAADRAGRNSQNARQDVLERVWRFAQQGLGIARIPTG